MAGKDFYKMNDEEFKDCLKKEWFSKFSRGEGGSGASVTDTDYESDVYNFDNPKRGLALIIVDEITPYSQEMYLRDKYNLEETFEGLGFDVMILPNLKAHQMYVAVIEASTQYSHANADCFVCVILAHGEEGYRDPPSEGVQYVDDVVLGHNEEFARTGDESARRRDEFAMTKDFVWVFNDANCPDLKNKPRLFFVEACRGEDKDKGIIPAENVCTKRRPIENAGGNNASSSIVVRSSPLYQDCLIMYATPPGYKAWGGATGSWFITNLCKYLKAEEAGGTSLIRVLTQVSGEVALISPRTFDDEEDEEEDEEDEEDEEEEKIRQMPIVDTMLIKDIYMRRKDLTVSSLSKKTVR